VSPVKHALQLPQKRNFLQDMLACSQLDAPQAVTRNIQAAPDTSDFRFRILHVVLTYVQPGCTSSQPPLHPPRVLPIPTEINTERHIHRNRSHDRQVWPFLTMSRCSRELLLHLELGWLSRYSVWVSCRASEGSGIDSLQGIQDFHLVRYVQTDFRARPPGHMSSAFRGAVSCE
jgi:hypothetical protein